MTLQMVSGMLIVLAILIVPCIPMLYLLYRFARDFIQVLKEILGDYPNVVNESRVEFLIEYLQNELEKQDRIREQGVAGYYISKAKDFWKEYHFVFYAIGMLLLLTVTMFRRVIAAAVLVISRLELLPNGSVLIAVLQGLILFYYIICKKTSKKWKAAIALCVIVTLKQVCHLLHGSIEASADMVLFVMLFLAVHHHQQWKRELEDSTRMLQQRMLEERYADDAIVQQYLALQKHRLDIGERSTIFQQLRNDDEVDEMMQYLNWLEQPDAEAAEEQVQIAEQA